MIVIHKILDSTQKLLTQEDEASAAPFIELIGTKKVATSAEIDYIYFTDVLQANLSGRDGVIREYLEPHRNGAQQLRPNSPNPVFFLCLRMASFPCRQRQTTHDHPGRPAGARPPTRAGLPLRQMPGAKGGGLRPATPAALCSGMTWGLIPQSSLQSANHLPRRLVRTQVGRKCSLSPRQGQVF